MENYFNVLKWFKIDPSESERTYIPMFSNSKDNPSYKQGVFTKNDNTAFREYKSDGHFGDYIQNRYGAVVPDRDFEGLADAMFDSKDQTGSRGFSGDGFVKDGPQAFFQSLHSTAVYDPKTGKLRPWNINDGDTDNTVLFRKVDPSEKFEWDKYFDLANAVEQYNLIGALKTQEHALNHTIDSGHALNLMQTQQPITWNDVKLNKYDIWRDYPEEVQVKDMRFGKELDPDQMGVFFTPSDDTLQQIFNESVKAAKARQMLPQKTVEDLLRVDHNSSINKLVGKYILPLVKHRLDEDKTLDDNTRDRMFRLAVGHMTDPYDNDRYFDSMSEPNRRVRESGIQIHDDLTPKKVLAAGNDIAGLRTRFMNKWSQPGSAFGYGMLPLLFKHFNLMNPRNLSDERFKRILTEGRAPKKSITSVLNRRY